MAYMAEVRKFSVQRWSSLNVPVMDRSTSWALADLPCGQYCRRAVATGLIRTGREGVVDGDAALGEVPAELAIGRHPHGGVVDRVGLVPLERHPEEGLVLPDRAAEGAPVEIEVRVGLVAGSGAVVAGLPGEEPQRARLARPVLPEQTVMPGVRPRLAGHVEDAAAGAPHLRVVRRDLDLDFLHRLDRGDDGGAVPDVDDGDAVQRVVVAAPRSAPE